MAHPEAARPFGNVRTDACRGGAVEGLAQHPCSQGKSTNTRIVSHAPLKMVSEIYCVKKSRD